LAAEAQEGKRCCKEGSGDLISPAIFSSAFMKKIFFTDAFKHLPWLFLRWTIWFGKFRETLISFNVSKVFSRVFLIKINRCLWKELRLEEARFSVCNLSSSSVCVVQQHREKENDDDACLELYNDRN
jgi:hypothetical protein